MDVIIKRSQQIDAYLNAEMSPEEIKSFELELKLNAQLYREFILSVEIDQMISNDDDVLSLREQLQEIHERKSSSSTRSFSLSELNKRVYLAAASIALMLMITGLLYLVLPKSFSNERLFSMYYDTEEVLSVSRSADSQLFDALIKYQQREFHGAARLFEAILREDEYNIVIRFYSGVAYIETQLYYEAIAAFKKIIAGEDNLYIEHATWFLGLTYLRIDETEKALSTFDLIRNNPDHYNRAQAEELYTKLTKRED